METKIDLTKVKVDLEITMDHVIQFLEILFSWPIAAIVIVVLLIFFFHKPIAKWIETMTFTRQRGDTTYTAGPKKQSLEEKEGEDGVKPPPEPQGEEPIPTISPSDGEIWRKSAYYWEYLYLNYYLVAMTQNVLNFFKNQSEPRSYKYYDTNWKELIPKAAERKAIIDVLLSHFLLGGELDALRISDKGREYIKFRGPLPKEISLVE